MCAFPVNANNIVTTNLDAGTDDPSAARVNLKNALDEITNIINAKGQASGIASLDSNTKILAAELPDEINSSSGQSLTLDPNTGIVIVEDILKLNPRTKSQLNAVSGLADGMCAFASDVDADSAGADGVPVYYRDGFWRTFSNNAII
tara:strand:- start:847 stop:1287 length:441 start_codon:yes stop_codon:yes gene_type:complete